jgi:hypothetical protein
MLGNDHHRPQSAISPSWPAHTHQRKPPYLWASLMDLNGADGLRGQNGVTKSFRFKELRV